MSKRKPQVREWHLTGEVMMRTRLQQAARAPGNEHLEVGVLVRIAIAQAAAHHHAA
jgi:hypothetical protein